MNLREAIGCVSDNGWRPYVPKNPKSGESANNHGVIFDLIKGNIASEYVDADVLGDNFRHYRFAPQEEDIRVVEHKIDGEVVDVSVGLVDIKGAKITIFKSGSVIEESCLSKVKEDVTA